MNSEQRSSGSGGGIFIALGVILGAIGGIWLNQPTMGILIGITIGVVIAVIQWYCSTRPKN